jgi:hypothetical protein
MKPYSRRRTSTRQHALSKERGVRSNRSTKHTQSSILSMPVITKVVQATFSYPTALRVFKDLPQKLPISNFIRQTASSIQSANIKGSR